MHPNNSVTSLALRISIAVSLFAALLLAAPVTSNAVFSVSQFGLVPSPTQAAGHPTISFGFYRNGLKTEDLRDVQLEFPAGQFLNPEAVPERCTESQFNLDLCPAASAVGSAIAYIQREWAWNPTYSVKTQFYLLESDGVNHAVIGWVMRPTFAPKQFIKQVVTIDAGASKQVYTMSIPSMMGTNNIIFKNIKATYTQRSKADRTGPLQTINPSDCKQKTARLTATSYQDVVSTAVYSWVPTGCTGVPFAPSVEVEPTNPIADAMSGVRVSVAQPTADSTVQQSTLKNVVADLPPDTLLNAAGLAAANGGVACTETELSARSCPAATRLGAVTANYHFYPPAFTGDIHLMGFDGTTADVAAVIDGPRGISAVLRGQVATQTDGSTTTTRVSWSGLPNIPSSSIEFEFDGSLVHNPNNCASPVTSQATITGHSDGVASVSDPIQLDCPRADTLVTAGPVGGLVITDPTPAWEFSSDALGATFECSLDGGAWAACTSPYQVPDERGSGGPNGFDTGDGEGGDPNGHIDADETGSHTFVVRADDGIGPDLTPAEAHFDVGRFNPTFSVTMNDPADLTDTLGDDAASNSDVTVAVVNAAGDLHGSMFTVPDYVWFSSAATPRCSSADALAGSCDEASRIGTLDTTIAVNRAPHDALGSAHSLSVSGPIYLTQAWNPGDFGGAVAEVDLIDSDGRNYGKVNLRIYLALDEISTDNVNTPDVEENTSISNPRGLRLAVDGLPAVSPAAVDGASLELHTRNQAMTLWGLREHYDNPLFTNSSDCTGTPSADRPAGSTVEWSGYFESSDHTGSSESDTAESTQPYSVDNCEDVPFAPVIENFEAHTAGVPAQSTADPGNPPPRQIDTDSDGTPDTPTPLEVGFDVTLPPDSSAHRRIVFDMPPSIKQRIAAFANACDKDDTQQNVDRDTDGDSITDKYDYVACDINTTKMGTIELDTPLVATPLTGEVFMEDEPASSIPNLYVVFSKASIGMNMRLRMKYEWVTLYGGIGFNRLSLNTNPAPGGADLPGIPVVEFSFKFTGSASNGPLFEVNSGCQSEDAVSVNLSSRAGLYDDGDPHTVGAVGERAYFGTPLSPCLPVHSDLDDNPSDLGAGASPRAGDKTGDSTPSWIASRSYHNGSGNTRHIWFECSTDDALWRTCGDFTPSADEVQRLIRAGSIPSGSQTYALTFTHPDTGLEYTTGPIGKAAGATFVQSALANLSPVAGEPDPIGPGDVVVSGLPPSSATNSFTITFTSGLSQKNIAPLQVTQVGDWGTVSLSMSTLTQGESGTWWDEVQTVPNGTTTTLSRVVAPQSSDLPLASGREHKFSLRLKSASTKPTLAYANSGDPVGVESYSAPYTNANYIEIPFMVDTQAPSGTQIVAGPADAATTDDSPRYSFRSDDLSDRFECSIDAGAWQECLSGDLLPGSPFAAGSNHTFDVRARDGLNVDPSPVTRTFNVSP